MKKTLLTSIALTALAACSTDTRERAGASAPAPALEPTPEAMKAPERSTIAEEGAVTTDPENQPRELGHVRWMRDFEAARTLSGNTGKPMFVLFTEVPGCSTVTGFADRVLTHPLVVDAIESEFVPVAVYNNVSGVDREVLDSFGEPTWNNPVVRIIQPDRTQLAPRFSGPYDVAGVVGTVSTALARASRPVPAYLELLADELAAASSGTDRAVFSMYCFWSGEAKLGAMEGVVASRTGFSGGAEVVEVEYDPSKTSASELGRQFGSKPIAASEIRSSSKDDKYRLRHTAWRHVPLSAAQASRINAAIDRGVDPRAYASPGQIALHDRIVTTPNRAWPDVLHRTDLTAAWAEIRAFESALN